MRHDRDTSASANASTDGTSTNASANTDTDAGARRPVEEVTPRVREGQRVRARFGEREVRGDVLEVRTEPDGSRRVVLDTGDAELDTSARRVTPLGRRCPACDAPLSGSEYRCPACGTDLVEA